MARRVIETIYDLTIGKAKKKIAELSASYSKHAAQAEAAGKKVDASFSSGRLTTYAGRVSALRAQFAAIVGVVTAAAAAVLKFGKDAAESEVITARLAANARNLADATDDQIESLIEYNEQLSRSTRFTDEQINSAAALGLTFRLTTDELREFLPRALDVAETLRDSTGQTVQLESVVKALGKAYNGSIGDLARYGITMDETQEASFKAAEGSERLAKFLDIIDANAKGAAESAGKTLVGAWDRLVGAVTDVGEATLGAAANSDTLKTAVSTAADEINALSDRIKDDGLRAFITDIIAKTPVGAGVLVSFARAQEEVAESTDKAALALQKEKAAREAAQRAIQEARENLALLGIDYEQITTGISSSSRKQIEAFEDVAASGKLSTNQIIEVFEVLAEKLKDQPEALDLLVSKLGQLDGELGFTSDQVAAFASSIANLKGAAQDGTGAVEEQTEAIKEAGFWAEASAGQLDEFALARDRALNEQAAKDAQSLADGVEEVAGATSRLTRELNDYEDVAETAADATEDVDAAQGSAAESSALWLSEIIGVIQSWRGLGGTVAEEMDRIVSRLAVSGRSFQNFHRRFAKDVNRLNDAFLEAAENADAVLEAYQTGAQGAEELRGAAIAARSEVNLLDQQRLDALQRVIDSATESMNRFTDATEASLQNAQDELLRLTSTQEEVDRRRTQSRIESLEEQLLRAGETFNAEAEANIREELRTVKEIQRIREQHRDEESRAREQFRQAEAAKDIAILEQPDAVFQAAERTFTQEQRHNHVHFDGPNYFIGGNRSDIRELARVLKPELDDLDRLNQ